jgi:arylsulfatase A-like enzyme
MHRWVTAGLMMVMMLGMVRAADRPNILLILADDQRFDTIRALGNPEIHTPTLDRLVQRGFVFTNAYCMGGTVPAVCAPSRTMLLTGKSLFKIPPLASKDYAGPMLPSVIGAAGYDTLHVGKPGNSFRPAHRAFATNIEQPHSGEPTSERAANAVIAWLRDRKPADRPFFVYLAPSVPHDPRQAPEPFRRLYDPAKLTLSPNFRPAHPFDNGELKVRDELLAAIPRQPEEMRQHLADYYACISNLDAQIGRILEALDQSGQAANTIVVFTSDQGLSVGGRHGLMGKQNLYEEFKSPLVIAGPGIPHGQSDALVYLHDLFPTLCDWAGAPVPKEADGSSLAPIVRGETPRVRETLFTAYRDVQRAIRDDRWKLIWYPKIDRVQLFDLSTDPWETNDLSPHPDQADRVADLRRKLAADQAQAGDPLKSSLGR